MIGETISDQSGESYTLQKEIGRGGFGVVYRALSKSGGTCAVKVMGPVDESSAESFEREMAAAATVEHENVLGFMGRGKFTFQDNEYLFNVMGFSAEGNYRALMLARGVPYPTEVLIAEFTQLLSGLEALHQHVVHRDIKPENILRFGDTLKVADLGLSRFIDDATRTLTFKGSGTPLYMAPEVWEMRRASPATDLYAIGVMLYESLTGQPPFVSADLNELRKAHLFTQAPRIKTFRNDIPDHIDGLVRRLLEKDSGKRYQSASEVMKILNTTPVDTSPGLSGIREKARKHHDETEGKRLAAQREADSESEKQERIRYMEQQLITEMDEIVSEINNGLQETQIERRVGRGTQYCFGNRTVNVEFFSPNAMYQNPSFPDMTKEFKAKGLVHAGIIEIREYNNDREGWNVVLLQTPENPYGEWYLVESELSPLSGRATHFTPVATSGELFQTNLFYHWHHAMHTWQLKSMPLDRQGIEKIFATLIP